MKKALIIVDVQKDFCEGGSLAVTGGNEIAQSIRNFITDPNIDAEYAGLGLTLDWHEPDSANGGHIALPPAEPDYVDSWPAHCIADTEGASLHNALKHFNTGIFAPLFRKGYGMPSYSGFEGSDAGAGSVKDWLDMLEITHVDVVGIAADYCVKATALDAVVAGFKTNVIPGLTVGIHEDGATVAEFIKDRQK